MKFGQKVIGRLFLNIWNFRWSGQGCHRKIISPLTRNTPLLIFSSNFLLDEIVLH
jgi:hypothetical protein